MKGWDVDIKTVVFLSVLIVFTVSFSVTGPVLIPFSGVVSESMEPSIQVGDLVIISSPHNPNPAIDTTISADKSVDRTIGPYNGSVIVFRSEKVDDPIIHRVEYKTSRGENWVNELNDSYVQSGLNCESVDQCPAPYAGYITKGDNNSYYDQLTRHNIVRPDMILGVALIKIPDAGFISVATRQSGGNTSS